MPRSWTWWGSVRSRSCWDFVSACRAIVLDYWCLAITGRGCRSVAADRSRPEPRLVSVRLVCCLAAVMMRASPFLGSQALRRVPASLDCLNAAFRTAAENTGRAQARFLFRSSVSLDCPYLPFERCAPDLARAQPTKRALIAVGRQLRPVGQLKSLGMRGASRSRSARHRERGGDHFPCPRLHRIVQQFLLLSR